MRICFKILFRAAILLSMIIQPGIMSSTSLARQDIQEEAVAINIEVPVRVFRGDRFVADLKIDDFEVYEDGILQKAEAVYLINKDRISREDSEGEKDIARKKFSPQLSRNFILFFELNDYLPKIGEVIDYFFKSVLLPGDTLKVVTPARPYNFKKDALEKLSKKRIAEQLKGKLRKDIFAGSAPYRSLIKEYKNLMSPLTDMDGDLKIMMAMVILRNLRDLQEFSEKGLIDFADYLKRTDGQKHVFLFYQKYEIPYPEGLSDFHVFELMKKAAFDADNVKQAFSDSSITSHFLYITKSPAGSMDQERSTDLKLNQSGPIFSAFREVAVATGGLVDSSFNPAAAFKRAVDASENYYLLYYSPKNYKSDGKFKKIKIRVKGKRLRVTHRAGYIAN